MTDRRKLTDYYRHTLEARRREPEYQEHLARGRRMSSGGVPVEALSREDLIALLSYTAGRATARKKP